jgi:hypothetical protein
MNDTTLNFWIHLKKFIHKQKTCSTCKRDLILCCHLAHFTFLHTTCPTNNSGVWGKIYVLTRTGQQTWTIKLDNFAVLSSKMQRATITVHHPTWPFSTVVGKKKQTHSIMPKKPWLNIPWLCHVVFKKQHCTGWEGDLQSKITVAGEGWGTYYWTRCEMSSRMISPFAGLCIKPKVSMSSTNLSSFTSKSCCNFELLSLYLQPAQCHRLIHVKLDMMILCSYLRFLVYTIKIPSTVLDTLHGL